MIVATLEGNNSLSNETLNTTIGPKCSTVTFRPMAQIQFESPPLKTRMDAGLPQKLLTFSEKYGDERVSKSA